MQHISVGSSFSASASSLRRTHTLALTGVLIAMQLALSSVAVYVTADMRITFGFLTIAATATLFGPVVAGVHGALADILACFLFPAGAYFPGYTLSALLVGLLYGLFFYRREVRLWHVLVAQLVVDLLCHVLLNTLWQLDDRRQCDDGAAARAAAQKCAVLSGQLRAALLPAPAAPAPSRVAEKVAIKPNPPTVETDGGGCLSR